MSEIQARFFPGFNFFKKGQWTKGTAYDELTTALAFCVRDIHIIGEKLF